MSNKSSKTEAEKKERVRKLKAELAEAMAELVPEGSFAEEEQAIADLTRELQQEMTKGRLQRMSDGFGERVLVGGKAYKRYSSATVRYHSLAGPLAVEWSNVFFFGQTVKALHVLRGYQAVVATAQGRTANGSAVASCFIQGTTPFEQVTAGGCQAAVKHSILNTYCN